MGARLAIGATAALAAVAALSRRRGSSSEIRTTSLPVGTELYHGTQAPERFDVPRGPAWFSDSEGVADNFVRWNRVMGTPRPRIYTFEVVREIPGLALIETPAEMEAFVEVIGVGGYGLYGLRELAEAVCDHRWLDLAGWVVPYNYPDGGSDTMLCDPDE